MPPPPPPSSSSVSRIEQFTYRFTIEQFSHLTEITSPLVRSSRFKFGGYSWAIDFFHRGSDENGEWCSVGLWLHGKLAGEPDLLQTSPLARVRFAILDLPELLPPYSPDLGTIPSPITDADRPRLLKLTRHFVSKSRLLELIRDDSFVLKCTMDAVVHSAPPTSAATGCTAALTNGDLVGHLGELLDSGDGSDVKFCVRDQTFRAHRWMLASRSPVFKSQLCGPMKEAAGGVITVDDVEPAVFAAMLRFVYTATLPDPEEMPVGMIQRLFVLGDKYGMGRMTEMCVGMLTQRITVDTVATTLALAVQHGCQQLKDACVDYIVAADKTEGLMESGGMKHLAESCPSVMLEILRKALRRG